jgi:Cu-Zn family superoxide dismutase
MKSNTPLLSAMAAVLIAGGSTAAFAKAAPSATAVLLAADGVQTGKAKVVETTAGLDVTVWIKGLPGGAHAAHVHTTGTCTPPDFASAGGHWNPEHKQHGKDNPMGMHMGDMPNVMLDAAGKGMLKFTIPGAKLTSGPEPLLDADGAAIVIHAQPDDMKTDPTGNAGGRLACGVLKAS